MSAFAKSIMKRTVCPHCKMEQVVDKREYAKAYYCAYCHLRFER